ncbi:hypothetical protein [Marinoscillum pacificum]|uniref:hypothetical protein n=1 Tax=Marinoscillum pacificum TaxID=392723 RepID=UPI0021580916|nr:hypothetical protein [Marinoscillum pacificum]|tara:strand:+ start:413 stop:625 length:213 start_codon:yes stop_codon:yes gene_type:complete
MEIKCQINGKEYTKAEIFYLETLVSEMERANDLTATAGEVVLTEITELDLGRVDEYCQRMVLNKVFGSGQ